MGSYTESVIYESDTTNLQQGAKAAGAAIDGMKSKIEGVSSTIGAIGTVARGFGLLELVNVAVQGIDLIKRAVKDAQQEFLEGSARRAGATTRFGGGSGPTRDELEAKFKQLEGPAFFANADRYAAAGLGAIVRGFLAQAQTGFSVIGFDEGERALALAMDGLTERIDELTTTEEQRALREQIGIQEGFESRLTQDRLPVLLGAIREITTAADDEAQYVEIVDSLNAIRGALARVKFLEDKLRQVADEHGSGGAWFHD